MERPTSNIKNPKIRAYMEAVTEGKPTADKLTADEYEEGVSQFIEGLDTALAQADEMIARAKLGDVPEAISFSYIAKKYFGKSRGWLMQKVNGNMVNGKQAAFTEDERKQFRAALQDISKQLSIAALAF
jgi:soluble cytochrome b562